jgi:hypothetical protein
MKTILVSLILSLCITSGLVFYTDAGRVRMSTLSLKNGVKLTVRPAVVTIHPQ